MTNDVRLQYWLKSKAKGITAVEIAEHVGCSGSLLSRWFNGHCNVNPEIERKVKQYIDETVKYRYVRIN